MRTKRLKRPKRLKRLRAERGKDESHNFLFRKPWSFNIDQSAVGTTDYAKWGFNPTPSHAPPANEVD
jgi:hypothetical protein